MTNRQSELTTEAKSYNDTEWEIQQKANDLIANNEEIVANLSEQKVAWADLTKEQKHDLVDQSHLDKQQKASIISY